MELAGIQSFYRSPLGQAARKILRKRLHSLCEPTGQKGVLGIGYCLPYLSLLSHSAEFCLSVMLARSGVTHWSYENCTATLLTEENLFPLPDCSCDLILGVHVLEFLEDPKLFLREVWRVLAPQGKVIFIVPNRRGMWARFDHTPFGHGRPYSESQIDTLLKKNDFVPLEYQSALFTFPIAHRTFLNAAPLFETWGQNFSLKFSGVILAQAMKQVYAPSLLRPMGQRLRKKPPFLSVPTPA